MAGAAVVEQRVQISQVRIYVLYAHVVADMRLDLVSTDLSTTGVEEEGGGRRGVGGGLRSGRGASQRDQLGVWERESGLLCHRKSGGAATACAVSYGWGVGSGQGNHKRQAMSSRLLPRCSPPWLNIALYRQCTCCCLSNTLPARDGAREK